MSNNSVESCLKFDTNKEYSMLGAVALKYLNYTINLASIACKVSISRV